MADPIIIARKKDAKTLNNVMLTWNTNSLLKWYAIELATWIGEGSKTLSFNNDETSPHNRIKISTEKNLLNKLFCNKKLFKIKLTKKFILF